MSASSSSAPSRASTGGVLIPDRESARREVFADLLGQFVRPGQLKIAPREDRRGPPTLLEPSEREALWLSHAALERLLRDVQTENVPCAIMADVGEPFLRGRALNNQADTAQNDSSSEPVNRILRGDRQALAELFALYRPRLWRMINFRLHPQLQGRIDADDVLQEAWLRAADRIGYFLREASHSPFVWFRLIVSQTLIDLHRHHLGAEKRDASREFSIDRGWSSESTSSSLAFHLQGHLTSPSSALHRAEQARQLDVALQGMNDIDREVLALRHFEELSNSEAARVLKMSEQAASVRYVRALARLKQVLEVVPGFDCPHERTRRSF